MGGNTNDFVVDRPLHSQQPNIVTPEPAVVQTVEGAPPVPVEDKEEIIPAPPQRLADGAGEVVQAAPPTMNDPNENNPATSPTKTASRKNKGCSLFSCCFSVDVVDKNTSGENEGGAQGLPQDTLPHGVCKDPIP